MNKIDVPDWVVQAAMDAYAKANEDNGEPVEYFPDAMIAALTAALGAWVVPVGYLNKWDDGDETISARPAHPEDGLAQPLYTLRQEKPE